MAACWTPTVFRRCGLFTRQSGVGQNKNNEKAESLVLILPREHPPQSNKFSIFIYALWNYCGHCDDKARERNENVRGTVWGSIFWPLWGWHGEEIWKKWSASQHPLKEEHLSRDHEQKTEAQSRNMFVDAEEQQTIHQGWCSVNGWGRDGKGHFIFHWKETYG